MDDISIEINYNKKCTICLDEIHPEKISKTNCNHLFCENCLNDWFQQGKYSCPLCRNNIEFYEINNVKTKILPIKIENNNLNSLGSMNEIIRRLIQVNMKYKCYTYTLLVYNIYNIVSYYFLKGQYQDLYELYENCLSNNSNLEEIIENMDKNTFYYNIPE